MKYENLDILKNNKYNVPPFIAVNSVDDINLSFSNQELFAVRSSFSGEDSDTNSFAGQFDTYLNVTREDVPQAVEKVLCSFNKSDAYKDALSFQMSEEGEMFVIIQEMVIPNYSGILFTSNPQGITNETVIVVGTGLGDKVVEDKVPTTTYYFNNHDKLYYYEKQGLSTEIPKEMLQKLIKKNVFAH